MSRKKIREVGMIDIYRDTDTEEFVVKTRYMKNDNAAYFTNDLDDAVATANEMRRHIERELIKRIKRTL